MKQSKHDVIFNLLWPIFDNLIQLIGTLLIGFLLFGAPFIAMGVK